MNKRTGTQAKELNALKNQKVLKSVNAPMRPKAQKSKIPPPTTQELLSYIKILRKRIIGQNRKILALIILNVTLVVTLTAVLVVPKTINKPEAASELPEVIIKSTSEESVETTGQPSVEESAEVSSESSAEPSEEGTERYHYSDEDTLFFDKVFHTEAGGDWWSKELKQAYAEVMDNNVQTYGIEDGLVWPKFENAKDYNYVVVRGKEVTEEDLDPENRELARKVRDGEVERLLPENFICLLPGGDCMFREDGTYYGSAENFAQECGIEEYRVYENTVFFPEEYWTEEVQAALERYNASLTAE